MTQLNTTAGLDSYFDLAIIGAGIYGSALYWEACHRGLRTILIEQQDFGAATSSNSLRTIHGGLRYLQSLDVARCVMSAHERQVLLGIAPNLIYPLPCVMPTRRNLSRSKAFLKAGTLAYDLLTLPIRWRTRAGHKVPRTRLISLSEMQQKFPSINLDSATGGALWHDAQVIDSERLTLAYVLSGDSTGLGQSLNHTLVDGLLVAKKRVEGVQIRDKVSEASVEIKASAVVDCSGSWNFFSESSPVQKNYGYIKGFNLVFKSEQISAALGTEVECEGRRSRLIFMSPWQGKTIAGTWYVPADSVDDKEITEDDLTTALDELRSISVGEGFSRENLQAIHVGQMPASRAQETVDDLAEALQAHTSVIGGAPSGLYRLQGTKYTTAREGAKRMVDVLERQLKVPTNASLSHEQQLLGCRIQDIVSFKASLHTAYDEIYGSAVVDFCIAAYGENADELLQIAMCDQRVESSGGPVLSLFEHLVIRAFTEEKAKTLSDLLDRRLGNFPFDLLESSQGFVIDCISKHSQLDRVTIARDVERRM